ncbi:hypothetical protein B0H66DRAFT_533430 [Apodospora peruviana]|uniref:Uncharacterized protein n=1 Tax=Apodospora peruviana TaxID=516989 RepID=A0AAE0I5N3_9PEZI|nr:hypothetical protein B0H66DRAFT_533430 [Apodospora peruviana]
MDRTPNLKVEIHDCSFSSTNGSVSSFCSTPISMYTPTGRSSPLYPDSGSFDPCFSQPSSFDFGYTPASSVVSSGYPFSLDLASATPALLDSGPCCTPSRCNTHGGYIISAQEHPMSRYKPLNSTDFISLQDHFISPQFKSPVHSVLGPSPSNGFEGPSMWPMLGSSPLKLSEQRGRPASRLSVMTDPSHGDPSPFDAGLVSPRQQIDLAQVHQKSAALQRLQRATTRPQPTTSHTKVSKQPVEGPRKSDQRVVRKTNWCTMGCKDRGFSRKEHLTRHIKE